MPRPEVTLLDEISHLLELNGENPFKVRAFERAARAVESVPDAYDKAAAGELSTIPGIGRSIAEVLEEFFKTRRSSLRDELEAALPLGFLDLIRVPGLGPKKARHLIQQLSVRSLEDLEKACQEDRLLELKGFGEKAQKRILEGVQMLRASAGWVRLPEACETAARLEAVLRSAVNRGRHPVAAALRVERTGALRRRLEIINTIEFLVELPPGQKAAAEFQRQTEDALKEALGEFPSVLPVQLHFAESSRFGSQLVSRTGSDAHLKSLGLSPAFFDEPGIEDEEKFYSSLGLFLFPPETRETGEELALARSGGFPNLLEEKHIQGCFHNHTGWSDGLSGVEEMVQAAIAQGFRYLGISDHSQSASYAGGLKPADLRLQKQEIDEIRAKYPDFRIFWGIESEIRTDGSLDYEDDILAQFDFVVASVHSGFSLSKDEMTERVLRAVRNPYTRILGHPTGRLLLERKGYDIDLPRVIAEAARHRVAIEINANPYRLDVDWRWGPTIRETGALIAISPDAHVASGLRELSYGITIARKALLPTAQVLNALNVQEVERWLKR